LRSTRQRGFSFLEMLIVVTIMALIMVVAIPAYKDMVMRTQETGAMQAIRTLHTAQMQCFSQNNRFAVSLRELGGKWIQGTWRRARRADTNSAWMIRRPATLSMRSL
jgi:prepilin-type N-terminal cleavage/methylation domain-containing protein